MTTKSLGVAALALLAAAAATTAQAQSSVTLFGVVDVNVRSIKNDTRQTRIDSSGLSSSRLGFRGVEDLGDGLKAGFWLEAALNPDDGNASGLAFQRRSTVSLMGNFGEVRLGRDKVPTQLNWDDFDPFGNTGMGAVTRLSVAPGLVPTGGAFNTFSRASNLFSYFTPNLGGFYGQLSVSPDENTLGNGYQGFRAGYRAGPLHVSLGYGQTEVTSTVDAKETNIGASYDLKFMNLIGFYSTLDVGPAAQNNWLIGVTVPMDKILLRASVSEMDGKEALTGRDARMIALGASYNLSRRTALYSTYSRISNDGTRFTVGTGAPLAVGRSSTGYEVGLRHSF